MISFRYQSYLYEEFKENKRYGTQRTSKDEQYKRLIIFLLTVSQFVKLFAFRELVWTKIIASFYLGSFLVTEFVVVWPVAWMEDIEEVEEEQTTVTTYSSIALAVAFMLWFASVACTDIFGQSYHTLPQWAAGVIGSLGAVLAIPALGYSYRHRKQWRQVRVTAGLLLFVLGAPIGFYFMGQAIPNSFPLILVQIVTAALAVLWEAIEFLYASAATGSIREKGKEAQRNKVEQIGAWYFFLLHLITAALFYIYSYDPVGTVKPAWTEYLG